MTRESTKCRGRGKVPCVESRWEILIPGGSELFFFLEKKISNSRILSLLGLLCLSFLVDLLVSWHKVYSEPKSCPLPHFKFFGASYGSYVSFQVFHVFWIFWLWWQQNDSKSQTWYTAKFEDFLCFSGSFKSFTLLGLKFSTDV